MNSFLRDFLTYDSRQRRGLLCLLIIIFVIMLWLLFAPMFYTIQSTDFSKFEKEIEQLQLSIKKHNDSIEKEYANEHKFFFSKKVDKSVLTKAERFEFNPNNLDEKDWKRLGLSDKQIFVIKNFESKGGKFKSKADVKKMYCLQEQLYLSLEPYIKIPIEEKNVDSSKFEKKKLVFEIKTIELNSADSLSLITIPGIKGFFASQIIKYRNLLGGFYSKEQLKEIYHFDSTKYFSTEKYFTLDNSQIKKTKINSCTDKELKHKYLDWKMVNAIINYRKKHGNYKSIEEIKKTDLVNDSIYSKIAPYLTTE